MIINLSLIVDFERTLFERTLFERTLFERTLFERTRFECTLFVPTLFDREQTVLPPGHLVFTCVIKTLAVFIHASSEIEYNDKRNRILNSHD